MNGRTDAEGPYVIRCRLCDGKLMRVSYPLVYRPKTLDPGS